MGLKEKALAGEKLEDVLIIDADAHYMVEYLPNFDDYIQRMDRVGIDKLFCSTMGNLDFQKSYPDRILSMYRYRDLSPDHELQKKDLKISEKQWVELSEKDIMKKLEGSLETESNKLVAEAKKAS